MNGTESRRLAAIEAEVEKLAAGTGHAARLMASDPRDLTDAEAVDAVRRMCRQPIPRPDPEPFTDEEKARILAEWRALRGRQGS